MLYMFYKKYTHYIINMNINIKFFFIKNKNILDIIYLKIKIINKKL